MIYIFAFVAQDTFFNIIKIIRMKLTVGTMFTKVGRQLAIAKRLLSAEIFCADP